jgi:hypothetical protein
VLPAHVLLSHVPQVCANETELKRNGRKSVCQQQPISFFRTTSI